MRRPNLDALLAAANMQLRNMTPEEQAAMWKEQRESWARGDSRARGEMAFGSDADEANYHDKMKRGGK